MTSIDSVKPALAHPFPINITGDVLAANFKICQSLNRGRVLGRDKPPSNPLLDVLVSPDTEKPCSTNGASKDFNCSRYRIRFVHETNSIQDKLVSQAEKQECLAVTGKKNRPTVPPMNTVETIGQRIARLREAREMSMMDLATACKVSWQSVQQWENGKTAPSRKRAELVASMLGVTVGELMAGEKSATPQTEAPTTEHLSSEHRAECLAAAIRSMLEGAGLEPDRLGTEQELRAKLSDDDPSSPDPHIQPDLNRGRANHRSPRIERG